MAIPYRSGRIVRDTGGSVMKRIALALSLTLAACAGGNGEPMPPVEGAVLYIESHYVGTMRVYLVQDGGHPRRIATVMGRKDEAFIRTTVPLRGYRIFIQPVGGRQRSIHDAVGWEEWLSDDLFYLGPGMCMTLVIEQHVHLSHFTNRCG